MLSFTYDDQGQANAAILASGRQWAQAGKLTCSGYKSGKVEGPGSREMSFSQLINLLWNNSASGFFLHEIKAPSWFKLVRKSLI